jgi:hypothetical protein
MGVLAPVGNGLKILGKSIEISDPIGPIRRIALIGLIGRI